MTRALELHGLSIDDVTIVNEAINLRSIDLLLRYCGIYLATVVFFSALKYLINIIQTIISQRATANMRKELYHHILHSSAS